MKKEAGFNKHYIYMYKKKNWKCCKQNVIISLLSYFFLQGINKLQADKYAVMLNSHVISIEKLPYKLNFKIERQYSKWKRLASKGGNNIYY